MAILGQKVSVGGTFYWVKDSVSLHYLIFIMLFEEFYNAFLVTLFLVFKVRLTSNNHMLQVM